MGGAIVGSRGFHSYSLLESTLTLFKLSLIVSGGAKGADTLAERYAKEKGIDIAIYKPDYGKYGKSAPLVRNKQIIEAADICIAFWDGQSKGTKHVIDLAKKANKECFIIKF